MTEKRKRGFAVPPGMETLVNGAKVQTTGEGATPPPADEPAKLPADAEKTPPAASPQAEEPKKPWEDLSQKPTGTNFMPDAALHAKMAWVSAHVPGGMSRLRILRDGANALCDALIAQHYKP